MKISYDVTCMAGADLTGVGTYVLNLYKALQRNEQIQLETVYRFSRFKKRRFFERYGLAPRIHFPVISDIGKNNQVFHGPDTRLICSSRRKSIVTVHDAVSLHSDLTSEEFHRKHKPRLLQTLTAEKPDLVLTVSETIKIELIELLPQLSNKIMVAPNGCDHLPLNKAGRKPESVKGNRPFFFFVGNLEKRKNIAGLVRAFQIIHQRTPEVQLILAGKPSFKFAEIRDEFENLLENKAIVLTGYVHRDELTWLYRNSTAFIFPSFYEGFGIPVAEAMRSGTPVVHSDHGAMAEVAGNAGIAVQAHDVESIADGMQTALNLSQSERHQFIEKGRIRARQFSWQNTAEKTLAAYRRLHEVTGQ